MMQDGRPILSSLILYSIKVGTLSHMEVQILFLYSAVAYLTVPGTLIPMNMKTSQQVSFICRTYSLLKVKVKLKISLYMFVIALQVLW